MVWVGQHLACHMGNLECVKILVAFGCDYAMKTDDGMTGLDAAQVSQAPDLSSAGMFY